MHLRNSFRFPGVRSALAACAGAITAFWPLAASAQLPSGWDAPLCSMAPELCGTYRAGVFSLIDFATITAIPAARTILIGIVVIYFFWYAVTLIIEGSNENTLTESRKAFANAAFGLAFIAIGTLLVDTFSPSVTVGTLVNASPFYRGVELVAEFLTLVTGGFLVFLISVSGFRIIALQGNESEIEKQKKSFFNGLLGVVILLFARVIVLAIVPSSSLGGNIGPLGLVSEIAGIIKFLLELVAGLAVIALIASGVYFITSLHSDERQQRARRMLTSTVIVIIIVIASHMIVTTFIR